MWYWILHNFKRPLQVLNSIQYWLTVRYVIDCTDNCLSCLIFLADIINILQPLMILVFFTPKTFCCRFLRACVTVCPYVCDHMAKVWQHDILRTACWNFTQIYILQWLDFAVKRSKVKVTATFSGGGILILMDRRRKPSGLFRLHERFLH